MVFQPQQLIPLLRQANLSALKEFLQKLPSPGGKYGYLLVLYNLYNIDVEQYLRERTHGGCNILHLLASLASPVPPTPTAHNNSGRGRPTQPTGLREIMHQALQLASTSG